MKYEVIHDFNDIEDGNHTYTVGGEYPRPGLIPKKERIAFLLSDKTKFKKPVIEAKVESKENPNE